MTTTSRVFELPAAARMTCSSWCRFMARELTQDLVSRRRGEKSRKGVGLSQTRRSLVATCEHTQNAAKRPPQLLLPLQKIRLDSGIRIREPTLQGPLCLLDPRGIFRQSSRDGFTERATAFVDEPMILHTGVKLATAPNSGEAISHNVPVLDCRFRSRTSSPLMGPPGGFLSAEPNQRGRVS